MKTSASLSSSPKSSHAKSPAPLETAADKNGNAVDVQPESKKRQLELQGELERVAGPERVEVQDEVKKQESGGSDQNSSTIRKQ
ncbi:MAG TPA: hypothetical protein PLN52_02555 [Opitutaceae bacterium]|nr:hypothetical protein [Opitutaceae bacterium]